MISLKLIVSTILIGSVISAAAEPPPLPRGCGEVNVIYTGLPGRHRLVNVLGWDKDYVDNQLRTAHKEMVNAGYNVKSVQMGPEQDIDILTSKMEGTEWDVTGIGYGMRGSKLEEIVTRFEDLLMLYRKKTPDAPIVFNYDPQSFLWSIQRRAPLSSDCVGSPGTDLGYEDVCQGECDDTKDEL